MCKNTKKEKIEKGELTDIVWEEKRTKQEQFSHIINRCNPSSGAGVLLRISDFSG